MRLITEEELKFKQACERLGKDGQYVYECGIAAIVASQHPGEKPICEWCDLACEPIYGKQGDWCEVCEKWNLGRKLISPP